MANPTPSIPGLCWERYDTSHQGIFRVLRVTARYPACADHFILTLNHRPIGPPSFSSMTAAIWYAQAEWLDTHRTIQTVSDNY